MDALSPRINRVSDDLPFGQAPSRDRLLRSLADA